MLNYTHFSFVKFFNKMFYWHLYMFHLFRREHT